MNDYFDASTYEITAGARARASDINTSLNALETGLDKLPSEINLKRGLINYAVDSGAADAYVITLTYAPAAYTDGMQIIFKASASNTGACTINVNSLGVKSITRQDGSTPAAGDVGANKIIELRYNSTSGNFEIQGSIGAQAGSGTMASQNANAVSITGGAISGITDLAIADGGTGASTASAALSNLGLTATASELNTAADGISDPPLAGDATAGRVVRKLRLKIEDGTNANTIKCTTYNQWNGDANSAVDNIQQGATSGVFQYYSANIINILNAGITGSCVAILAATIITNATTTPLITKTDVSGGGISCYLEDNASASPVDLDVLVDTGSFEIDITYITNA